MAAAENVDRQVKAWSGEIVESPRRHGGGNKRIAIDKIEPLGLRALEQAGYIYVEGQELTEKARAIKSSAEIEMMGWAIRVCEAGLARMYENSQPGRTEQEIWAELHFENARSGGEWIETRLLKAGPGTNPWYTECSDYVCRDGDMIAVDTDMIGPYGYCADLSRAWICGHRRHERKPSERLYAAALDQIRHNLGPGRPRRQPSASSTRSPGSIPERLPVPYRYALAASWRRPRRRVAHRPAPSGLRGVPAKASFEPGMVHLRREPARRGRQRKRQAGDPGSRDRDRQQAAGQFSVGGELNERRPT